MSGHFTSLTIAKEDWSRTLAGISQLEESYFSQAGKPAGHRGEEALADFLRARPYGNPVFNSGNRTHNLTVSGLDDKAGALETAELILRRDSLLNQKAERIIAVADEIMLNALLSAPRLAQEAQAAPVGSKNACRFVFEWNNNEIWIHGQDPFGVFLRTNFQRSFRAASDRQESHGHAGRGLEIILSSSTDLYIKSNRDWGTWVAARIDLVLSNRENDIEPKRLFLDFK